MQITKTQREALIRARDAGSLYRTVAGQMLPATTGARMVHERLQAAGLVDAKGGLTEAGRAAL